MRAMLHATVSRTACFAALAASIALAACSSQPTPTPASTTPASTVSTSGTHPNAGAPAKKLDVATGLPAATSPATIPDADKSTPAAILIEVDRPPFAYTLKQSVRVDAAAAPKVVKASAKKNAITNDVEWYTKNGLRLAGRQPVDGPSPPPKAPDSVPAKLGSNELRAVLEHGDHTIVMYGPSWTAVREIIVVDKSGKPRAQYDFSSFVKPPEVTPGQEAYTYAQVLWAIETDGVLYVSTAHSSYAKNSNGKNAFVTAIDAKSGDLLWQSEPLVCNARSFVIHGAHILCGYGYTSEPDFLYVLSRADGKTVSKMPLESGPSYLVMKDGKLYVRTYATDYVFKVE